MYSSNLYISIDRRELKEYVPRRTTLGLINIPNFINSHKSTDIKKISFPIAGQIYVFIENNRGIRLEYYANVHFYIYLKN